MPNSQTPLNKDAKLKSVPKYLRTPAGKCPKIIFGSLNSHLLHTGIFSHFPASTLSPSPIPYLSLSIAQCPASQSPSTISSSQNQPAILAPSSLPSPGQCPLSLSLPGVPRCLLNCLNDQGESESLRTLKISLLCVPLLA